MAKMLEDIPVFISYCDSHNIRSFFCFVFFLDLPLYTIFFIAKSCAAVAKTKVAALNFKGAAKYKGICYLFPCGFIYFLCSRSPYAQLCSAFFLA